MGTAAAAATRRIATGHSLRCTRKRQVSLMTVIGWLQWRRSWLTVLRWRSAPGERRRRGGRGGGPAPRAGEAEAPGAGGVEPVAVPGPCELAPAVRPSVAGSM